MQPKEVQNYIFGRFYLNVRERILLCDGKAVPITLKAFSTLFVLVQRSGHIVEKDELMEQVWPNAFVEEANLTQNVYKLRKVLGVRPDGCQYIETVPGRGYRFTAATRQVKHEDDNLVVQRHADAITDAADNGAITNLETTIISLAILPFANASADPDAEYLSDGITESLISILSGLPQLRIMSRNTVFRYKNREINPQQIGRDLKVRAVVTGRVLQLGDILNINIEMIDVADGSYLWNKQYNSRIPSIFKVQEEISRTISEKLQVRINYENEKRLTEHYNDNTIAYKLYLKGRYFWNKRTAADLKKGFDYFQQSIQKDASFALAYAGLADSYILLANFNVLRPVDGLPKAKAMALKALELDDTLIEARTSLALARVNYDWDWPGAEREYKRIIEMNPNYATAHHWYGQYLAKTGHFDEALIELKRAQELEPLSLIISVNIGRTFYFMRQYEKAIDQCLETLEIDRNYVGAQGTLALAYARAGFYDKANSMWHKVMDMFKDDPELMAFFGNFRALSGKREEALELIDKLKRFSKSRYISTFNFAIIYTGLAEKDQAFRWLEKAYEERSDLLTWLKVEPTFDSLRAHSRFQELLQRIGLT
jgi:TolB-like protein/Tfp pilus assembly protein PilF